MKNLRISFIALVTGSLLYSCESKTDPEQVKALYEVSEKEGTDGFCINDHEAAEKFENSADILRDLDYVCYQINYTATDNLQDSIMVLNRRNISRDQTLFYDFATRNRELETWNKDNGKDKREKIADNVYLRTLDIE